MSRDPLLRPMPHDPEPDLDLKPGSYTGRLAAANLQDPAEVARARQLQAEFAAKYAKTEPQRRTE